MKKALLVIDIQNDYFPGGKYPLWNADATFVNIEHAITSAKSKGVPVILIQHVADPARGIAPFFNRDTDGVKIHPRILEASADAPVVVKGFADAFVKTDLENVLAGLGVTDLLVCGMMTQNCVTHTAISKSAEKYRVCILPDCCTTVDAMIHVIALNAVSTRLPLVPSGEAM
jgi:nicotinamidase-related amidase